VVRVLLAPANGLYIACKLLKSNDKKKNMKLLCNSISRIHGKKEKFKTVFLNLFSQFLHDGTQPFRNGDP